MAGKSKVYRALSRLVVYLPLSLTRDPVVSRASLYWKTYGVVQHDRLLNGERLYRAGQIHSLLQR